MHNAVDWGHSRMMIVRNNVEWNNMPVCVCFPPLFVTFQPACSVLTPKWAIDCQITNSYLFIYLSGEKEQSARAFKYQLLVNCQSALFTHKTLIIKNQWMWCHAASYFHTVNINDQHTCVTSEDKLISYSILHRK